MAEFLHGGSVVSLRRDARKQYACAISISELPSPLLHIQPAGANQHVLSVCEWKIQRVGKRFNTCLAYNPRQANDIQFSQLSGDQKAKLVSRF